MAPSFRWSVARRVAAVAAVALALQCASPPSRPRFVPPAADLAWLRELQEAVIEAARAPAPALGPGERLVTPAGLGGYPAFWIRDFSMACDGGAIGRDEIVRHLRVIAASQNGAAERRLAHGLVVPPFAVPDHVTLDGGAVFFPGTYASGDDQGSGRYGVRPPQDDGFEFVHVAWHAWKAGAPATLLREPMAGRPLLERLRDAFAVAPVDRAGGAVVTDGDARAVGFGFCDAIVLTGALLFPTLLRERAALELAELSDACGEPPAVADRWRAEAATIRAALATTFRDPAGSGFLLAATGVGRQRDVWGTLFALERGVLEPAAAAAARRAVADAARRGTIALDAAVRHVPTDGDARADSAWERADGVAVGSYQNGAWWHAPAGWLIAALAEEEPELAARLFAEFVGHLRRDDFRLGPGHGAPWECFGPGEPGARYAQNGAYVASIALPLASFARLTSR